MASLSERLARVRLPAVLLAGLLQRTPVIQVIADAADFALESRVGMLLKAAASLAALGAVDSLAGATAYTLTTGSPGHPSPYTVTEGSQIEGVLFALSANPPTDSPPQSWTLSGKIPPGLKFGVNGDFITSAGFVNTEIPTLVGTPTSPGTYTMILQAWEFGDGTGISSSTFTYQVIVQASVTPTPTPTP